MPVLLLAQGDAPAKDKLRKAIEARYGLRPPAIESLKIEFKGRVHVRLGPIGTWVPVEASAAFQFPTALRWDFIVRAVGIQLGSGIEAFDGTTYRTVRGSQAPTVIDDLDHISSMQRRLWAIAALLLTPLGEHFVKLSLNSDGSLDAANTQIGSSIGLTMRENNTLGQVDVTCLNPDTDRQQKFTLRLSDDQALVNELMLPCRISAFWDNAPYFEIEPMLTEINPTIPPITFTLSMEA